ncbi:hypothetical protein HCX48_04670 [Rhodocyclus tenuis]|uniref:Uncharacterized protein n=1 Tax=Rhodocyclus gracilis TaxID=2929842 RepID=A0ABX0WIV6_9RHOO|nr:hypothetical protein [Rhodocyclus gracilis]NJA88519.1 hypothetical protein [Rhodocyclus gracilis]
MISLVSELSASLPALRVHRTVAALILRWRREIWRSLAVALAVLFAGEASSVMAAEPAPAPPVDIVAAEFGVFVDGGHDELVLVPTRLVPHVVGQRYGWAIELRTARRSVSVREEYVRPPASPTADAAVASDPVRDSLQLPVATSRQVSQRQLVPVNGLIYGEWAVGPGEPAGHRTLRVVIENEAQLVFDYDMK